MYCQPVEIATAPLPLELVRLAVAGEAHPPLVLFLRAENFPVVSSAEVPLLVSSCTV